MSVHMYPRDAAIRKVSREGVLLAGAGRALLMQLAHPSVARGVAEHSDFARGRFARLRNTLLPVYSIVFGTAEQARQAAARVRARHQQVRGHGYVAEDQDLLLWVHATLVDSALLTHRRFVHPMTAAEADAYYRDSMELAGMFGLRRESMPADVEAFRRYVDGMVARLEVSDTARGIAAELFRPVPAVLAPATFAVRELTAGLLPSRIRQQYGLSWDRHREAALGAICSLSRAFLPLVPMVVRQPPSIFMPRRTGPAGARQGVLFRRT